MDVWVDKEHHITSDSYNYILRDTQTPENSYYYSLDATLKGWANHILKSHSRKAVCIDSLIELLEELQNHIENTFPTEFLKEGNITWGHSKKATEETDE